MNNTVELKQQLDQQLQQLLIQKTMLRVVPGERPPISSQLMSHIGGDPYFEADEEWPVNPETGQPLELIFQLVSESNSIWPFPAQVVQFYHNYYEGDLPFDESEPEDYRIKIYPAVQPEKQVLLPRPAALPSIGFSHIELHSEPALPDDDELEYISSKTLAICRQLAPEKWQSVYNEAVEALIGEQNLGSWVGGYAHWLQGAYPTGEFLMQFDSTEDFMWGDSGLLYFFYDPEEVTSISFQLQCM